MTPTLEDQIRALADRSVGAVDPSEGVVSAGGRGSGLLDVAGSPVPRRPRAWLVTAVALVVLIGALAAVALWRDPERQPVTTTPDVATTQPGAGLLDDATWQVSSGQSINSSTDQVLLDVRPVACHAGIATPHLSAVEERGIEVIITATVDLTAGPCVDDTTPPLQLLVQLPRPLGDRVLLDGACLPEGDLFRSVFCDDGQRWPDEPDPRVRRRPGGWQLGPDGVGASDSSFVVGVTRIECNGGQSGDVGRPTVELGASEVLVSFWTPPLAGDAPRTCPGNAPNVVEVDLGEPLGDRVLIDGGCLEDGRLPPNLCERWRP